MLRVGARRPAFGIWRHYIDADSMVLTCDTLNCVPASLVNGVHAVSVEFANAAVRVTVDDAGSWSESLNQLGNVLANTYGSLMRARVCNVLQAMPVILSQSAAQGLNGSLNSAMVSFWCT